MAAIIPSIVTEAPTIPVAAANMTETKSGAEGFGYDPIFTPEGYELTFAEMNKDAKGKISHRGKAVKELVGFLQS